MNAKNAKKTACDDGVQIRLGVLYEYLLQTDEFLPLMIVRTSIVLRLA